MATRRKPPWKRPRPKTGPHTKLRPSARRAARARARKAGRRYPNLVDNMRPAAKSKRKKRA